VPEPVRDEIAERVRALLDEPIGKPGPSYLSSSTRMLPMRAATTMTTSSRTR
jgi:hypothetical protein